MGCIQPDERRWVGSVINDLAGFEPMSPEMEARLHGPDHESDEHIGQQVLPRRSSVVSDTSRKSLNPVAAR